MLRSATFVVWVGALTLAANAAPSPSLILNDLRGEPQDLSKHRGHVMVLNFWATWCLPCREEIPLLVSLQDRFAERGVMVIGAAADIADTVAARDKLHRFQHEMKMNYQVWTGATVADMEGLGLGDELPVTVIIDRNGEIAARILGVVDRGELEGEIESVLGESPAAIRQTDQAERSPLPIHGGATVPS